jgi:hypothetical protein
MKLAQRITTAAIATVFLLSLTATPAFAAGARHLEQTVATGTSISIPAVPIGILTLLGFLTPLAIAVVTNPAWSAAQRKIVSIITSIALAAGALVLYFALTHEPIPEWPLLVLLSLVVAQASYTLVLKGVADRIDRATSS